VKVKPPRILYLKQFTRLSYRKKAPDKHFPVRVVAQNVPGKLYFNTVLLFKHTSSTLKMEAMYSSKTLVTTYKATTIIFIALRT
jgi:hypothetical protein